MNRLIPPQIRGEHDQKGGETGNRCCKPYPEQSQGPDKQKIQQAVQAEQRPNGDIGPMNGAVE